MPRGRFIGKIVFDRVNPVSKNIEKGTNRSWEFDADNEKVFKKEMMRMFKKDEPTRRKVHSVEIKRIADAK